MTFARTDDLDLVRAILTDPACWFRMVNDSAPLPEHFGPQLRDRLAYVIAYHRRVAGLFVLVLGAPGVAEVHFCLVPDTWGRERTTRIGREFVQWVWDETSIHTLIGPVPGHNLLALKLAEACGFERISVEPGAVTKNGKTYDLIVTRIQKTTAVKREEQHAHAIHP